MVLGRPYLPGKPKVEQKQNMIRYQIRNHRLTPGALRSGAPTQVTLSSFLTRFHTVLLDLYHFYHFSLTGIPLHDFHTIWLPLHDFHTIFTRRLRDFLVPQPKPITTFYTILHDFTFHTIFAGAGA